MTPKIKHGISVFFGLALLAGIAFGIYAAGRVVLRTISAIDSSIAVAVIAAAGTALVSVVSIVLGKAYEARAKIEQENREKKIPVYEDLIRFVFRVFMGQKSGSPVDEKEMLSFMMDFSQRIMVWGADDVIAAWVAFRGASLQSDASTSAGMQMLFLYEQLVYTIRRDLGHRNRNLKPGDILSLWVNDIHKYLPNAGKKP